jgi:hypothetical protein
MVCVERCHNVCALSLQPWLEIKKSNFLRDYAPMVDNFDETWQPGEDMEQCVHTPYTIQHAAAPAAAAAIA